MPLCAFEHDPDVPWGDRGRRRRKEKGRAHERLALTSRPLDFFEKCSEDLELDPIFRATRGFLQTDHVFERRDLDADPLDVHGSRSLDQIEVALRPRRSAEAIEISRVGLEREVIARLETPRVEEER